MAGRDFSHNRFDETTFHLFGYNLSHILHLRKTCKVTQLQQDTNTSRGERTDLAREWRWGGRAMLCTPCEDRMDLVRERRQRKTGAFWSRKCFTGLFLLFVRQGSEIRRNEGGFRFGRHEKFAGIEKAEDFLLGELRLGVDEFIGGGSRTVFSERGGDDVQPGHGGGLMIAARRRFGDVVGGVVSADAVADFLSRGIKIHSRKKR